MDFIDQLRVIGERIGKQADVIQTEEATKNAFVMPFIQALGYDIFDPTEVVPEFTADVGVKKGEKVDYAIVREGVPIILIECKWSGVDLARDHASQLYRYFSVTHARIAVLTNGVIYRFFTDLEAANKMDEKPFLEIDLLDLKEPLVDELKKLTKSSFNLEELLEAASELKYLSEIKRLVSAELRSPSDDFIRFFGKQVYAGHLTQTVREQFRELVKRAFSQVISDRLKNRLQTALEQETGATVEAEPEGETDDLQESDAAVGKTEPTTTEEEREGFLIVKAILRRVVDISRVYPRDTKSYFGILLDDNNRRPLCRLHFNRAQKYLGLFDAEKKETRVPIESLDDIYEHAEAIRAAAGFYG